MGPSHGKILLGFLYFLLSPNKTQLWSNPVFAFSLVSSLFQQTPYLPPATPVKGIWTNSEDFTKRFCSVLSEPHLLVWNSTCGGRGLALNRSEQL